MRHVVIVILPVDSLTDTVGKLATEEGRALREALALLHAWGVEPALDAALAMHLGIERTADLR